MSRDSQDAFRIVLAVLALLTAALIIIPNRYWVALSKKLVPPSEFRDAERPNPWG